MLQSPVLFPNDSMTYHCSAKPRSKPNHNRNSGVGCWSTELSTCAGLDWTQGEKRKGHHWELMGHCHLQQWRDKAKALIHVIRIPEHYEKIGHMVNWDINNGWLTGKVSMDTPCWSTSCHCIGRSEQRWWLDQHPSSTDEPLEEVSRHARHLKLPSSEEGFL